MRVGSSFDIHKLVKKRPLFLGGIRIESKKGLLGHSDGDCVIHSICESLIGAMGLGDMGDHFPMNASNKNRDSKYFLEYVINLLNKNNYKIINLDILIICDYIRLENYKALIKDSLSKILFLDKKLINVKATTYEKMDCIGRKKAIASQCVCLID